MSTEIKRLPADWSKDLGIDVLDADGWRNDGTPWGLAITEQDFRRRAAMSTMREVATPAPLDPSKVKAGDTVTVTLGKAKVEDTVAEVADWTPNGGTVALTLAHRAGDPFYLNAWTLTDHQPAPKPEWKPQFGHALVDGLSVQGFLANDGESFVFPLPDGGYHEVGVGGFDDFVPDEDRARLAVETCRHLHQDGLTREEWHKAHCGAVQPLQDIGAFVAEIDTDILHDGSYVEILRAEFGALHRRLEQAEAMLQHLRGESR